MPMTDDRANFDMEIIERATKILASGNAVVAPTDTHYTLLADPTNPVATAQVYQIKERDPDFPLTIFLSNPNSLDRVAVVTDAVRQLAKEQWPGFLTIIVPKRNEIIPDYVTAGLPTVAVACHHNPILTQLIENIGGYAACTSANRSGQGKDLITFAEARQQIGDRVPLLIDAGEPIASKGNTIVDLTGPLPLLVREGEIPIDKIRTYLPDIVDKSSTYKTDLKRRQRSIATWRPTLEGMTALVTGAARGRGSELARVLAHCGVHVMVTDRVSKGESIADELQTQGLEAEFRTMDVTDPSAWEATTARIIERWGRLDLLVNNAGYFESLPLKKLDNHTWEQAFQVNTYGALYGLRTVAAMMHDGGSIVNMSSVFALTARPYAGIAYETSKGALLSLTRSVVSQLAPAGIRVNAVAPGLIRTPMTEELFTTHDVTTDIPLGRTIDIFDIVDSVCFLASPVSSYITGTILTVDGGLSTC